MRYDVWFARSPKGSLVVNICEEGEAPHKPTVRCTSVHQVLSNLRKHNKEIAQVGICDYEMIRTDS